MADLSPLSNFSSSNVLDNKIRRTAKLTRPELIERSGLYRYLKFCLDN